MNNQKCPYVCGPLTELVDEDRAPTRIFYEDIATLTLQFGPRAFVPHEHYDPVSNLDPSPTEVDSVERRQVTQLTSVLIVAALAPSWGGGIEVEMANTNHVPVIILCEKEKLEQRRISGLLLGNPAIRRVIAYTDQNDALQQLKGALEELIPPTL